MVIKKLSSDAVGAFQSSEPQGSFVQVTFADAFSERQVLGLVRCAQALLVSQTNRDAPLMATVSYAKHEPITTIKINVGHEDAAKAAETVTNAMKRLSQRGMSGPLAKAFVRTLRHP